jgi:hypothetical protein
MATLLKRAADRQHCCHFQWIAAAVVGDGTFADSVDGAHFGEFYSVDLRLPLG